MRQTGEQINRLSQYLVIIRIRKCLKCLYVESLINYENKIEEEINKRVMNGN